MLKLELIPGEFSICRVNSLCGTDLSGDFFFLAKTDKEISLVCRPQQVPENTAKVDTGWKALRVTGVLDFGMVGILAGITSVLAKNGISVFAVSTFNTDYILVKSERIREAVNCLGAGGYVID